MQIVIDDKNHRLEGDIMFIKMEIIKMLIDTIFYFEDELDKWSCVEIYDYGDDLAVEDELASLRVLIKIAHLLDEGVKKCQN